MDCRVGAAHLRAHLQDGLAPQVVPDRRLVRQDPNAGLSIEEARRWSALMVRLITLL